MRPPLQHDGPLVARAPDSAHVSLSGRLKCTWVKSQISKWVSWGCPRKFAVEVQLLFLQLLRQRHLLGLP